MRKIWEKRIINIIMYTLLLKVLYNLVTATGLTLKYTKTNQEIEEKLKTVQAQQTEIIERYEIRNKYEYLVIRARELEYIRPREVIVKVRE